MEKGRKIGSEIGSQGLSSPKYQQMLIEKLKVLQDKGILPQENK